VETREQARLLLELGCPRAQGWLFAKALPVAELRTRLDEQRRVAAVPAASAGAPGPVLRVAE
jgi:EAL domain-containing protein (putative c-di-GMP-specific phosphodiesterase class I)